MRPIYDSAPMLNPSPAQIHASKGGRRLNHEALQRVNIGDFRGAEHCHRRAIELKEECFGRDHTSTALSYNGLGELYIRMGRIDEAEEYLNRALRARRNDGPVEDLVATRDNLGQVYEMRGDFLGARDIRVEGFPDHMCCSNVECMSGMNLRLDQLSQCAKCKSIFYCSRECQVADWKRHKKYCHD